MTGGALFTDPFAVGADTKPVDTTAPAGVFSAWPRRGIRELHPWVVPELWAQGVPEVRIVAASRWEAPPRKTRGGRGARLASLLQGRQDVLWAAVLAFGQPLAQLAEDRARNPLRSSLPSSSSLRAGNRTPSRYLPT